MHNDCMTKVRKKEGFLLFLAGFALIVSVYTGYPVLRLWSCVRHAPRGPCREACALLPPNEEFDTLNSIHNSRIFRGDTFRNARTICDLHPFRSLRILAMRSGTGMLQYGTCRTI